MAVIPDADGALGREVGYCGVSASVSSEIEISIFWRIFESAPDPIVVTDHEGRIVRVNNKEADKLLGYSHEELRGQSVELIVPEWLHAYTLQNAGPNLSIIMPAHLAAAWNLRTSQGRKRIPG